MPCAAFLLLVLCFLLAVASGGAALLGLGGRSVPGIPPLSVAEKGGLALFACLSAASGILLAALVRSDFSFLYVVEHTDRNLHLFYRLTAFWGGQEGALLFWAWSAALAGNLFRVSRGYAALPAGTRLWFWGLFFVIMGFFGLLLTGWNNPFLEALPPPADGHGLNPLLQNPGMIFHPPLLFMGYGAFTVPTCLALAWSFSPGAEGGAVAPPSERAAFIQRDGRMDWPAAARPYILGGWLLLAAGILLGAWWSYRELGWGGYWAWDPVENSSLVPWLLATACLHTALVERRGGKLRRANVLLMALVSVSAFFSTYIVRSGIIRSVHAFGASSVGPALLVFVLAFLLFALGACLAAPRTGRPLDAPLSREGMLVGTCWALLALAAILVAGTLWPVISGAWSGRTAGLSPAFYNTACLPLFTVMTLLLAVCPWVGRQGRVAGKGRAIFVLAVVLGFGAMLFFMGQKQLAPAVGAAAAVGVIVSACLLVTGAPGFARGGKSLGALLAHAGFAVIVLGVAFSGPYRVQENVVLLPGQSVTFGEYALTLEEVRGGDSRGRDGGLADGAGRPERAASPPAYIYSEAVIGVTRDGKPAGRLYPQLRRYAASPGDSHSEVDTVFSWGNELYCVLLGMDMSGAATLQVSLNPLVNWIWAGGALLCLAPLANLFGGRQRRGPGREAPQGSRVAHASGDGS